MATSVRLLPLLVLGIAALVMVGVPLVLINLGLHALKQNRPASGWSVIGVAGAIGLSILICAAWFVYFAGPWHTGILAQGTSPDGREYCIVQAYQNAVEPYGVDFYIRDASGAWHRHYLEHEDLAWRSAEVRFSGNEALVARNGKPFATISLTPKGAPVHPSSFSANDILESVSR